MSGKNALVAINNCTCEGYDLASRSMSAESMEVELLCGQELHLTAQIMRLPFFTAALALVLKSHVMMEQ